jgi:hypothetical protein
MATFKTFSSLCSSVGMTTAFRPDQLTMWCTFWCKVCEYSPNTLKNHFAAFARIAREQSMPYPRHGSTGWAQVKDCVRGLIKGWDKGINRATPLTRKWLQRMLMAMGIRTLDDLAALDLDAMTFIVRILVGQACFLRMAEHRDGMRVGDVSFTTNLQGQTTAILRVKERKDKTRMHRERLCQMPVHDNIMSSGGALKVYMARCHGGWRKPVATPDTLLYPAWTARGQATTVPASEYHFKSGMRTLAIAAGMPQAMAAKLSPHSLRSGGCTDALAAGMDESWVQMQGGWLSSVFKIYYRPMAADMAHMFERLKTMEIVMAQ